MNNDPKEGVNVWKLTYAKEYKGGTTRSRIICADFAVDAIDKSMDQDWCEDYRNIIKVECIKLNDGNVKVG